MFDVVGPLMPQVRSGNAKALVVTAKERIPAAPDVPTMAEAGVPDFVSGTWAGIIAPAGTPKEIVDRISAEAKKALADPAMKDKLAEQGIVRGGQHAGRVSRLRRRGDRALGQGDRGRQDQDGVERIVGWGERSETHQFPGDGRWVSLRSTHPTKLRRRRVSPRARPRARGTGRDRTGRRNTGFHGRPGRRGIP